MAVLNQRYDCYDFVLCDCGIECPRGVIIVFALETNEPCLGSEPMLTEKKTKREKVLLHSCGLLNQLWCLSNLMFAPV